MRILVLAGCAASLAGAVALATQRVAPWGYAANLETRRMARDLSLDDVEYVALEGPWLSRLNAENLMAGPKIIRDRREIGRILQALRDSCRKSTIEKEELMSAMPDYVGFWPTVDPATRGAVSFQLDARQVLDFHGPALAKVLKPYIETTSMGS